MGIVDSDLEDDLVSGRIDALLSPGTRDETLPLGQRRLRPLIADAQQAEEDYVRDFGVYPINHVIAFRNDVLARLPRLPRALFDAYAQAKARAYEKRLGTTLMPWGARNWNRTFDLFGGDPLPYGLNATNRNVIERLQRFLLNQRLIAREMPVEALFVPESREFAT